MATRTNRAVTLAISRTLNFIVQFVTPILLVRIFDMQSYGQYREFFVYVAIIGSFIDFGIRGNIIYFISKNPDGVKKYISNTIFLKFICSLLGISIVLLFRHQVLNLTSFNFIIPLIIFLFLSYNFDFLEAYWLTQKKSNYVLYYSVSYMIVRVITVVITAYLSKDVSFTIFMLLILEFIRFSFNLSFIIYKKLFALKIDYTYLKEQLIYIVPLGLATILIQFNTDISKVIISSGFGAGALAIYAIASQRIPVMGIIQTSVADVLFPDMAENINVNPEGSLDLWRRANILYLFLAVPLFYIQFYYAELIIRVLFTDKYINAVPIFQIYLFFFLRQCFDLGLPIRVMNKNKYMIIGYIFTTIINIGLIYLLLKTIGFIGPAIAYIIAETLLAVYFVNRILSIYRLKTSQLFFWKKTFIIIGTGLACLPILFVSRLFVMNEILSAFLFCTIYTTAYIFIIRSFKMDETNILMHKIIKKLKPQW